MEYIADPILMGNFYASSKKRNPSHVVLLNELYLGVFATSEFSTKTVISVRDIIGCRCTRRRKRIDEKCVCNPNQKNIFSFLDNAMYDSHTSDTSVYLHIYAYVLKKLKLSNGSKRERLKITLRFRSYANYEDNLKDALKWRETIKRLVQRTQWRSPLLQNVEEYASNVETGEKFYYQTNFRFCACNMY